MKLSISTSQLQLGHAISGGSIKNLALLLQQANIDVNEYATQKGETPIALAIIENQPQILLMLFMTGKVNLSLEKHKISYGIHVTDQDVIDATHLGSDVKKIVKIYKETETEFKKTSIGKEEFLKELETKLRKEFPQYFPLPPTSPSLSSSISSTIYASTPEKKPKPDIQPSPSSCVLL